MSTSILVYVLSMLLSKSLAVVPIHQQDESFQSSIESIGVNDCINLDVIRYKVQLMCEDYTESLDACIFSIHHVQLSSLGDASQTDRLSKWIPATVYLPIIQKCARVGHFFIRTNVSGAGYVAHQIVKTERINEPSGGD